MFELCINFLKCLVTRNCCVKRVKCLVGDWSLVAQCNMFFFFFIKISIEVFCWWWMLNLIPCCGITTTVVKFNWNVSPNLKICTFLLKYLVYMYRSTVGFHCPQVSQCLYWGLAVLICGWMMEPAKMVGIYAVGRKCLSSWRKLFCLYGWSVCLSQFY